MPLSAGEKLGTYEILAAIGAGGMGEVYRARDTKLGRDVAIKVLPAGMASKKTRANACVARPWPPPRSIIPTFAKSSKSRNMAARFFW
jgi:serine/threonine protein kinase